MIGPARHDVQGALAAQVRVGALAGVLRGLEPARALRRVWQLLAVCLVVLFGSAAFAYPVPTLTGPVVDEAKILNERDRLALESKIRVYRSEIGPQIQVYIARSLRGESVEDVSYQVAQAWQIGNAERDDGVLLLIALDDRAMRIETGKGVGDRLTDLQSAEILREVLTPAFRAERYADGIEAAVDDIARLLGADSAPQQRRIVAEPAPPKLSFWLQFGFWVVVMLLFFFFARRGGGGGGGGWTIGVGGGGWSSGGGGWSSGGGGGGWSGGGGSFGGGGASGRW